MLITNKYALAIDARTVTTREFNDGFESMTRTDFERPVGVDRASLF